MKCKYQKYVESYHKGKLEDKDSDQMRTHLQACLICSDYLAELKATDHILAKVKRFGPVLENPGKFKNEIFTKIEKRKKRNENTVLSQWIDKLIYVLIHPVTRYSFVTAALLIFSVFLYQQMVIVKKIGALEKRMEAKSGGEIVSESNRKRIEVLFRKGNNLNPHEYEFEELTNRYQNLEIKHRVLLKMLKEKYPEAYQDVLDDLKSIELLNEELEI